MKLGDLIKPKQYALEVLDMFLHKQCDLERTKFAYSQNEVFEAVKMSKEGLKELEQYRELGTVEEIKKKIKTELPYMEIAQAKFKSEVEELKRAMENQPKTDWIPCKADMPKEEYGTYWIAVEQEPDEPYYYCSAVWTSEHGFRTMDIDAQGNIIAWQPIQPYKKEGADDVNT